ncbi:MAG: cytochrome d ubiquinol oxidase subunit II [Gammaproteobacteria bacterium]
MSAATHLLGNIWYGLIGIILALYVVLDGFTLGVGMLSLFSPTDARRSVLMGTLGSVWDANETWLVLLGGALFGAFPAAYALLLHALYIPIALMLFGLVLRASSFEFREHARNKRLWNLLFALASFTVALAQGLALGTVLQGIPAHHDHFTGSILGWIAPFPIVVAAGVTAGYALLGSTYLVLRTDGIIQERARRASFGLALMTFLAAATVTIWTPFLYPAVAGKWFGVPTLYLIAPLPLLAVGAFWILVRALRQHREVTPFVATVTIFLASFAGLAVSLHPDIVPPTLTVSEAAASPLTLVFMLAGIGLLLPIMMVYNGYQYLVFRGKVTTGSGYPH